MQSILDRLAKLEHLNVSKGQFLEGMGSFIKETDNLKSQFHWFNWTKETVVDSHLRTLTDTLTDTLTYSEMAFSISNIDEYVTDAIEELYQLSDLQQKKNAEMEKEVKLNTKLKRYDFEHKPQTEDTRELMKDIQQLPVTQVFAIISKEEYKATLEQKNDAAKHIQDLTTKIEKLTNSIIRYYRSQITHALKQCKFSTSKNEQKAMLQKIYFYQMKLRHVENQFNLQYKYQYDLPMGLMLRQDVWINPMSVCIQEDRRSDREIHNFWAYNEDYKHTSLFIKLGVKFEQNLIDVKIIEFCSSSNLQSFLHIMSAYWNRNLEGLSIGDAFMRLIDEYVLNLAKDKQKDIRITISKSVSSLVPDCYVLKDTQEGNLKLQQNNFGCDSLRHFFDKGYVYYQKFGYVPARIPTQILNVRSKTHKSQVKFRPAVDTNESKEFLKQICDEVAIYHDRHCHADNYSKAVWKVFKNAFDVCEKYIPYELNNNKYCGFYYYDFEKKELITSTEIKFQQGYEALLENNLHCYLN